MIAYDSTGIAVGPTVSTPSSLDEAGYLKSPTRRIRLGNLSQSRLTTS